MGSAMTVLRAVATATALLLGYSGGAVAGPSASVDGGVGIYGGFRYDDPGASSNTAAVNAGYDFGGILAYAVSAGGGSLSGGPHPYLSISTFASNNGAWLTESWANAGTWSSFYVGARSGYSPLPADTVVPLRIDYASVLTEAFGSIAVGWNAPEPYNMAFFFDDVNWRSYNLAGSLTGNVRYAEAHSVGLYTSMGSRTQNVSGPGAWAKAELTAWVRPYVDPDWNAAHGNGYQVFYVNLGTPVPEPASVALLAAGLGALSLRRRKAARRP